MGDTIFETWLFTLLSCLQFGVCLYMIFFVGDTLKYLIGPWRAKREIVSFRVVRACAQCLCEVRSGQKSLVGDFPFSLFRREVFPFPSALQGPIQLQLALSVLLKQVMIAATGTSASSVQCNETIRRYAWQTGCLRAKKQRA